MWSGWSVNPMGASFDAARRTAANVPQAGEKGNYTKEQFIEDFPQFCFAYKMAGNEEMQYKCMVPESMLSVFLSQVNDSVLPSRWGSLWRYSAGLYVAHFSAMYLKTYAPESTSAGKVASSAQAVGVVKSASMGNTSISYDNAAVTAGTEKWGSWNATQYGQQLVTLARMVGMGGMYVI